MNMFVFHIILKFDNLRHFYVSCMSKDYYESPIMNKLKSLYELFNNDNDLVYL